MDRSSDIALRHTADSILNAVRIAVVVVSPEGRIEGVNAAASRLLGYRTDELAGRAVEGILLAPNLSADGAGVCTWSALLDAVLKGTVDDLEAAVRTRDGGAIPVLLSASPIRTRAGELDGVVCAAQDITALKKTEAALRESEERYALALSGANDGLWDWDLATDRVYFSPRWEAIMGCGEQTVGDRLGTWFNRVHPDDIDRLRESIRQHRLGSTSHFENEHRVLHRDGTYRWVLSRGTTLRDENGRAIRMAGSLTDVTRGRVADALTGLPNRVLLHERLERALRRSRRGKGSRFALLFLDLDRFKLVNDSLGHAAGDSLLINMARRLEQCLRSTDTIARSGDGFVVARMGGDEFTILLEDVGGVLETMRIAERLQSQVSAPFNIQGQEVFTSVSIGIALSWTGYERPEDMLRDADAAMYRAKALGKARYEIFAPSMRQALVVRMNMEGQLRRAVEQRDFSIHCQPIVSLDDGSLLALEALVRWPHAERGLIPPSEFIAVAEETGMILEIGEWVLRKASSSMAQWLAAPGSRAPQLISVNLSSRQFRQPDFVDQLIQVLEVSRLDPSRLQVEITERLVMENADSAVHVLRRLKDLGLRLAMDDFGTGYSSLSYLHLFPFDTLKVDRSFVRDAFGPRRNSDILQTVISLAHNLRLKVIAVGVETREQLDELRQMGCDAAQGFFLAPPTDTDTIGDLLANRPWMEAFGRR